MAVRSLSAFLNKLKIGEQTIQLSNNQRTNTTQGGLIYAASLGPRFWQGSIVVTPATHEGASQMIALAQTVENAGEAFLVGHRARSKPQSYTGENLGSVVVGNGITTGFSLPLSGLPDSFKLTVGDFLSYSLNGVNRLHQVSESVTATVSGTATVKLVNPIMLGGVPASGTAVKLIDPVCTAIIEPGSLQAGSIVGPYSQGFSFNWIQTFKV